MQTEFIRNFQQLAAAKAKCRYFKSLTPLIKLGEDDFEKLSGGLEKGKILHAVIKGTPAAIAENFRYFRFKKGDEMLLAISASTDVTMTDVDRVAKMFSPIAYESTHGVALYSDIPSRCFIVDAFIKYGSEQELRL